MRAISRENFTLSKVNSVCVPGPAWIAGTGSKYKDAGFTTTARLRVDADLTDNVAATIRLLNERSWGMENNWGSGAGGAVMETDQNSAVDIDLAYVTMKEFLYSPLTLTVGRQEMKFGNGFIVSGPDLYDIVNVPYDLSRRMAFDAIRANLNYDPLVVDLIYAKVDECETSWWQTAGASENNDTNLVGVNALYNLGVNNATAEVYWFSRVDKNKDLQVTPLLKDDVCNTTGFLVQGEVVPNLLKASVEYARQFGTSNSYIANDIGYTAKRQAWATQAMLTLLYKNQPAAGLIYTYMSGDNDVYAGKNKGWDPFFTPSQTGNIITALFPSSDCQIIHLWGGIKPTEDITISALYGYYRLIKEMQDQANGGLLGVNDYIRVLGVVPYGTSVNPHNGNVGYYSMTSKKDLGSTIDLTAAYDYTEDVQFSLTFGMMFLGDAFRKDTGAVSGGLGVIANHQNPRQIIGSMEVTF